MGAALWRCVLAEAVGTYLLVLFGTGSVASAVLTGSLQGLWQVASVWGFGVAISIYVSAGVSGAHLNPAVSLALALTRPADFPARRLAPYVAGQLAGSILAACCVLAIFGGALSDYEERLGYDAGARNSTLTAMVFGEYFPNPQGPLSAQAVTPVGACAIEAIGTLLLMFVIRAVTDENNTARPPAGMAPFFIGFTVSVLIALFAPLTQAGYNPARDFGPRLVAAAAGWGTVAIPGPRNGFWAYIVGPLLGAPCGSLLYDVLIAPGLPKPDERARNTKPGPVGAWCADQAVLQRVVREACAQVCLPAASSDDARDCCGDGAPTASAHAPAGANLQLVATARAHGC